MKNAWNVNAPDVHLIKKCLTEMGMARLMLVKEKM
jgi:hypothetical protein